MFLVPNNLQENLTCNFCHKFLTVAPVKVYPDNKTKCGRCPQSKNDGGAVSMYSQIAQLGVFKCVNRYDGCEKLLTYHEVVDHEEICYSKVYTCPECPETVEVPTFLMIKHFQDKHGERVLQKNYFQLDLDGVQQTETYMYRIEDNLFFVECRHDSSESFFLRSMFLGDQNRAETIRQQFTVRYDNLLKEVVTERKPCDSVGSEISASFQIWKHTLQNHRQVIIEFQLDLTGIAVLMLLPSIPGEEALDPDSMLSPRKLKLSYAFQGNHPRYSVSPSSTSIIKAVEGAEPLEIFVHCFYCSHPFTPGESYIELDVNKYQWVCWRCEEYCRKNNPHLRFHSYKGITPDYLEDHLYFSCKWGCEKTTIVETIFEHERYCSKFPKQACPVKDCRMRGNIPGLRKHFVEFHPKFHIKFGSLLFVDGPTTVPCAARWYAWLMGCFVMVVMNWEDRRRCRVQIHKPEGVGDKFNPGAFIFAKRYSSCLCLLTTENVGVVKEWNFYMKLFLKK